jgi:hypothetical protein
MSITRRSILTGIVGLLAAPAIVRISSLMPISVQPLYFMFSVGGVPLTIPYYPPESLHSLIGYRRLCPSRVCRSTRQFMEIPSVFILVCRAGSCNLLLHS